MEYKTCGDCHYCRVDTDTKKAYCKQTYSDTNVDSSACDDFAEDD